MVVIKTTCILYKHTERELKDIDPTEEIRYPCKEVKGDQRVLLIALLSMISLLIRSYQFL